MPGRARSRSTVGHADAWRSSEDAAFGGSVGMGTSMAMVGAYVLAGELAAAGGDHVQAFARYEEMLRGYVTENRKALPGGLRGFLPSTRFEIWLRHLVLNLLTRLPSPGRLSGGVQETANAVELRDYSAHVDLRDGSPGGPIG